MHRLLFSAALVVLALATARADNDPTAVMILAKAMRAHGGEQTLAKYQAWQHKATGTLHRLAQQIAFSGEWSHQSFTQRRIAIDELNNKPAPLFFVVDGAKGWLKAGAAASKEINKEQHAEEAEQMHVNWVLMLAPLREKAYTLTPLGETTIKDTAVVGIKVARKDWRDIDLFFDKQTQLLVKATVQIKDAELNDKEVMQEMYFSDYREAQNVKYAGKVLIQRDGKDYVEMVRTEMRYFEKLDNSIFAQP